MFYLFVSADLDLQLRIEYLSRAIMSAKSATFNMVKTDGDLLHNLEETLDVSSMFLIRAGSSCVLLEML